ncbi:hypothetical protein IAT38_005340 [Cryptococcus sp. DSM 104549]
MPPVPQSAPSGPAITGSHPNPDRSSNAAGPSSVPSVKPSPAVVASSSHPGGFSGAHSHVLPRRFLGPIPEKVNNSSETKEKRRRFLDLRGRAMEKLLRTDEEEGLSLDDFGRSEVNLGKRVMRKVRVKRRDKHGRLVEEDLDTNWDSPDGDEAETNRGKYRNEMWVGESFDIGREFMARTVQPGEEEGSETGAVEGASLEDGGKNDIHGEQVGERSSPSSITRRPTPSSRTTQETFVTARTEFSQDSPSASRSTLNVDRPPTGSSSHSPEPSINGSTSALDHPPDIRLSQTSSMQPLISPPADEDDSPYSTMNSRKGRSPPQRPGVGPAGRVSPSITNRLKSALRPAAKEDIAGTQSLLEEPEVRRHAPNKSKSVQFPVDPVQHSAGGSSREVMRGDAEPASPYSVLLREGEAAEGTSAGAVEDTASERQESREDWEDEEERRPGDVILRDRMLVRVGYHKENGITGFDEASQRRTPCARLEPMEEYIVVWRKGQVEFYQDWGLPLRERIAGNKHLCFVVPLLPNRTSLSIFNPDDVTICLTTSVAKLQHEVEAIIRSPTTSRVGAMKDRVKQSRQIQWLKGRREGTQVFIMKLGERSRAMDWYWELWRDLDGLLPPRFDIVVPSLSTSIRLGVPEDEESGQMGDRQLLKRFNRYNTIATCWEMLEKGSGVDELLRQREIESIGEGTELHLAWKASDGTLDWVAYPTTVEGKTRPWAMLAGLARLQDEKEPRELQLREARHQPKALKLEDGTLLTEPPGVEGYLFRIRGAGTGARETVYVSSHDGSLFISGLRDAHPPLIPKAEGSIPPDIFPDLHKEFLDSEHERMAKLIDNSAGCVDVRDIEEIQWTPEGEGERDDGSGKANVFKVKLNPGGSVTFEAHSKEVAQEWVERLQALKAFWKRRHRVEARNRMDVTQSRGHHNIFAGTSLSQEPDSALSEVWDWCIIQGCRSVCLAGRLYMKKDQWKKFRLKYVVLAGGCLVTFKIKRTAAFHPRKKKYILFGAYAYSGLLARDEIHEPSSQDAFTSEQRVYQDGLQSGDGPEDTTFCVRLAIPGSKWGKKATNPWELKDGQHFVPPGLSTSPKSLLIFRARSKLERDRWVWAINAEMERQVRAHTGQEKVLRDYGAVPDRWYA